MKITVGVKAGKGKANCDDTAIINDAQINDDTYSIELEETKVIGIADGVGGYSGGKLASCFVAKELSQRPFENGADEIIDQIMQINKALLEYAFSTEDQRNMATTLTAIVSSEDNHYLVHIGNTRMYVGQGSYLKQITDDHTTYQWLLSIGQKEAAESCNKNEISACMGGGSEDLAKRLEVRTIFEEGFPNILIFTSDGIHEYLDIDQLETLIFSGKSDIELINEAIEEAAKNGSEDDRTLIIVRK